MHENALSSSPSPLSPSSTLRNHRPDGPITVDDAYCKDNEETPDLSLAQRRRLAKAYEGVRAYVMFIGMGRTGHSLVGSLLDAHPHIAVANEADAMAIVRQLYDERKDASDSTATTLDEAPGDETEADDDDDDGSVGNPNRSSTKRKGAARRQRKRRAERKKKRVAARQRATEHRGAAQMSQELGRARGRRGMSKRDPPPQDATEQAETIQTWASAAIRDVLRRGRQRNASDYGTLEQLRGRRNTLYDELFRNTLRCRTRSGYVYDVPGQYQGQILDDKLYIMGDKKVWSGPGHRLGTVPV